MWGDKQNNSFWSPKARAPRFGEERIEQGRGGRGRRKRRRRRPNQGMFCLEIMGILDS